MDLREVPHPPQTNFSSENSDSILKNLKKKKQVINKIKSVLRLKALNGEMTCNTYMNWSKLLNTSRKINVFPT